MSHALAKAFNDIEFWILSEDYILILSVDFKLFTVSVYTG